MTDDPNHDDGVSTMSGRTLALSTLVACAALTASRGSARADILPSGAKVIAYSYEIENLEAHPDKLFVVWPRSCGSDGDPLGNIDLALNPHWESRMHEVDYEVLTSGKKLEILRYCARTMRVYALPLAEFPRGSRVATADDWTLGAKKDDTLVNAPALDAIDLKERIAFFKQDARVARSPFAFDMVMLVRASASSLKAVHDVIAVEAVEGATVKIVAKRAIYTYDDDVSETVPYTSEKRPKPSRPKALAQPGSLLGDPAGSAEPDDEAPATADAGGSTSAPDAAAPAGRPDIGTRWVFLAAVGGLLVGGGLAFSRRRKGSAPPAAPDEKPPGSG